MNYFGIINSMNKLDGNAATFLSTASITDWTITQAINNLVKDLKTAGLWSSFNAIYPMVGGNATAHRYNLINPSQYNLTFQGGWTHSSTGALPNGTNGFANTALNGSTVLTQSNAHISFYSRTNATAADRACWGAVVSTNNISLWLKAASGNLTAYNATNSPTTAGVIVTNTDSKGFYVNNKTSSAIGGLVVYKNGSSIGANTTAIGVNSYPNTVLLLSAYTSTTYFDNKECAFASIGLGFTAAQNTTFNTIVTNFQTALSRNV